MVLAMTFVACGKKETIETAAEQEELSTDATTEEEDLSTDAVAEEEVGMENPWRPVSEEEANQACANLFGAPSGAENVEWSLLESAADPSGFPGPLVQMTFDLDGLSFAARAQMTGDSDADISGMNYEWTVSDDITLTNWREGHMTGKTYRYVGENEYADLCTWFDIEIGIAYSLSVVAPDLDGFDIRAVAEAMYDAGKQASANIPDEEETHTPTDITGCDTFTQIVDKLEDGMGYANEKIGDTDVLLVSGGTYDYDGIGTEAGIDAEIYWYHDGVPEYLGYVEAGGTAYPLSISEGMLYVGGNHFMTKYVIADGLLLIDEEASEVFDTDGSATYYYRSDLRDVEADENGQVSDDSVLMSFFDDFENAEMVRFTTVVK